MTQFFTGRELPLSKKVYDQLANWVDKQYRIHRQTMELNEEDEENLEQAERLYFARICNNYAIRSCLEALYYTYG